MPCLPFAKQQALVLIPYLIYKNKRCSASFGYPRAHMDEIVVARGGAVPAARIPHGKQYSHFFNIGITHAAIADIGIAAPFKKMKILSIIYNAHAIGFPIGNAVGQPYLSGGKFMHGSTPINYARQLVAGLVLVLALLGLWACAEKKTPEEPLPPTSPAVGADESVEFFVANLAPGNQDLTSFRDMAPTIDKSLRHVNRKPKDALAINRPGLKVTYGQLSKTLTRLQELLPRLDASPGLLAENFQWVAVPRGIDYSGYYEPRVRASRTKKPGYEQAIYKVPPDLAKVRAKKGRYHDRRTIEEKQILAGRGLELAWAADPVDVFFLEIQGSGKLVFDDGSEAYINYAGQNGHKYKSSGRIMREKGLLSRGDIFEQREWFKNNPDRVREILNDNPSYVFFKFGGRGPTGAMGYTVDDWLSLAVDRSFIPLGAIVAYGVNAPDQKLGKIPLRGIGFAQDVGGAIKRNRIDIFCGGNERANYVASHLDAKGPAWILLAKD